MSKKKLNIKVPDIKQESDSRTIEVTKISKPRIDLRYLHYSNKCLKSVGWNLRRNKPNFDNFFDDFQKFILDFSSCESITDAMGTYSSHVNGSKSDFSQSPKVKNILKVLPKAISDLAKDEITHLHFKKGGKGAATVIGFFDGGEFNVLGLYDKHD